MARNGKKTALVFTALFFPLLVFANMVTIPVTEDTFILELQTSNNAGGATHVASGTTGAAGATSDRRGLFFFDVSAIPAGSVVNSATVSMNVVGVPGGGGVSSTFDLYSVQVGWGEGTQSGNNGSAAQPGDANWSFREFSTSAWSVPGGAIGVDYAASASASTAVSGVGPYDWTTANIVSDVQNWVDNPANNFGWVLISQSEGVGTTARQFGSNEGGAPAQLAIDFTTVIPEPSSLALILIGTGLLGWSRKRRNPSH